MKIDDLNRVNSLVDTMRNVQRTLQALEKEPLRLDVTVVTQLQRDGGSTSIPIVKSEESGTLTPDIAPMLLMYLADIKMELQELGVDFGDHRTTTPQPEFCGQCYDCLAGKMDEHGQMIVWSKMIGCPECGNKRCPHGTNHRNPCTASNESGQPGSRY